MKNIYRSPLKTEIKTSWQTSKKKRPSFDGRFKQVVGQKSLLHFFECEKVCRAIPTANIAKFYFGVGIS